MRNFFIFFIIIPFLSFSQNTYEIAVLKYNGGGDWYANPTALPNLIEYTNKNLGTTIKTQPATVEAGNKEIFNYPFIHMTGHGNVVFNINEIENLRAYLLSGGFLHIDDNYGMDPFIRIEIKKLFPEVELKQLANNHPIFSTKYNFTNGLPKIHEHDGKPAQAFGIVFDGRLVCLYTYETDLGDGWEDPEIHNNTEETRQRALKMGANIIKYAFTN